MKLNHRHLMAAAVALVVLGAATFLLSDLPANADRSHSTAEGANRSDRSLPPGERSVSASGSTKPKLPRVTIDLRPPGDAQEFVEMLRGIVPDTNLHRQRKALLDLMEHLTPESAPAVREALRELKAKGFGSDFAWWAFCTRWGEIDATGAFAYFQARPDDPGALTASTHIMEGWVEVDDRAARAWLADNKDSPLFRDSLHSYATSLGRRDLAQATSDVFGLNLDADALFNTIGPLVKNARERGGYEEIANWFDGMTETQKTAAFEHAMWAMKDADLTTAVEWFTANADKPWRNDKHFHHVASRYAAQEPKAAMEWAMSLPDDPGRPGIPAGLSTIMDVWTLKDYREAGTWLDEHSEEQWWPRAAMGHYRSLVRNNPGVANQFITGLPPERRGAVLRQLEGN